MIKSFADGDTQRLFKGLRPKRLPNNIWRRAARKLVLINAAEDVSELRVPPGSRLEKPKGDRSGQWSIRVNDQWRVCFKWREGNAYEVEITDYHR
jgi:proteic killer suppression protein